MSAPAAEVLLIDLENMIGSKAKPVTLTVRLDALAGQAGPGVPVVAACAGSRITADGIKILKERGIRLLRVERTANAADEALLEEARRRSEAGCRRFVVASNDSRLGQVADLGQLDIVIWESQKPRKNYTARAASIRRLPIPETRAASESARDAPAVQPGGRAATTSETPSRTTARPTVGRAVGPSVTVPSPPQEEIPGRGATAVCLAAAGIAALAAGMLFGVGAVFGASAAFRLLLRRSSLISSHPDGAVV